MYGVILWSDLQTGTAVVWCEEHGEIAYFENPDPQAQSTLSARSPLDAGDLVQFDLMPRQDGQLRVRNLTTASPETHAMPPARHDPLRPVRRGWSAGAAVIDLHPQDTHPAAVPASVSRRG